MDYNEQPDTAMNTADPAPRMVSPDDMARLMRWSRRKPAIALMGEFSAGKSTLLNFLLRHEFLPTQVTATQLPPVWLSYGTATPYVMYEDGRRQTVDLERIHEIPVAGTRFLRVYMEADILEAVDLIDTPGISDPKIPADVWRRAVGYVNGVIWCTHATQAWRESERAAWVSLPERLRHNSLLLVTRADKLEEKDRQKVLRRVNREAGSLFAKSILFSALDAIRARDDEQLRGGELWTKSGGEKLIDAFFEIVTDVMTTREKSVKKYKSDPNIKNRKGPRDASMAMIETLPQPKPENEGVLVLDNVIPAPIAPQPDPMTETVRPIRPARPRRPVRAEGEARQTERRIRPEEADDMRALLLNTAEDTVSTESDVMEETSALDTGPDSIFSVIDTVASEQQDNPPQVLAEMHEDVPETELADQVVLGGTDDAATPGVPDLEPEVEDLPDIDFSRILSGIASEADSDVAEVPEMPVVDQLTLEEEPDTIFPMDEAEIALDVGAFIAADTQNAQPHVETLEIDADVEPTPKDVDVAAYVAPSVSERTASEIWAGIVAGEKRPSDINELVDAIGVFLQSYTPTAAETDASEGETPASETETRPPETDPRRVPMAARVAPEQKSEWDFLN